MSLIGSGVTVKVSTGKGWAGNKINPMLSASTIPLTFQY